MTLKRLAKTMSWGAVVCAAATGSQAAASGGPPPIPDYVTADAVYPSDLAQLAAGNLGILKGAAPPAVLYLDWRLLHRLKTGEVAAKDLATPCCGSPDDPSFSWAAARQKIPGVAHDIFYIDRDRPGPNYTSIPTCYADAFVTAVATLHDRAGRFGARSPFVRAWLVAQDAVFRSCSTPGVTLPPLPTNAPPWLSADRAYQSAALALYDGRLTAAERGFAAIGRDRTSPWQAKALYLQARVIERSAMLHFDASEVARARAAIDRLAAAPAGTFGQLEAAPMRQLLDFHEHPRALLARLDHELNEVAPTAAIAMKVKDYMKLAAVAPAPEAADWIGTIRDGNRLARLGHARARWLATRDPAWLVAALSLAMPADPEAAALAHDAARIEPADPAWLTAQYHWSRLTIATGDPGPIRKRTDMILARTDLSRSDRNVFSAIRTQLATGPDDFVRFALRRPYCTAHDGSCIGEDWPQGDGLLARRDGAFVGLGGDARAVIDRLPMIPRVQLARNPALPPKLQLDIALTSYVRAVLLRDDPVIDTLAKMLTGLLPQLRGDWRRIVQTRPGIDKRFAEAVVMAKIPTLRTDLADYARPIGARDRDFAGYWVDWLVADRRAASSAPLPPEAAYLPGGSEGVDAGSASPPGPADLACVGRCGAGSFTLHLPEFVRPLAQAAMTERHYLIEPGARGAPATSLWGEMLSYVQARRRDPRASETLYRLIRIARWGGNHDHLGRRAFHLLHARYPRSTWAAQSPYYYDEAD